MQACSDLRRVAAQSSGSYMASCQHGAPCGRRLRRSKTAPLEDWAPSGAASPMNDIITTPTTVILLETERPRLHKVILVNDDFTPREFVVRVLKAEFRVSEEQAQRVMMTAHQRGVCVVAVFTKDIAESKATNATDLGRSKGYPLLFTTEPEE